MMQRTTLSQTFQPTSSDVRAVLPRPIASVIAQLPAATASVAAAIVLVLVLITVLTGAGVGFV